MIPLLLEATNFQQHKYIHIDFTKLGPAMLVVGSEDGSVRKSIGSGKSTIFRCINYAIYDAKPSNKKEKTIRNGESKCEVKYVFKLSDGSVFKIERVRTKTVHSVQFYRKDGDEWTNLSGKTATATDKLIVDVIGVGLKTFENTSYFKQSDMLNLGSATPEARKEIISGMLELGIWQKYKKIAEEESKLTRQELTRLDDQIKNIGTPSVELNVSQTELRATEVNLALFEKEASHFQTSLSEKKEHLSKLKSLTKDGSQIESKYNDAVLFKNEKQEHLNFINFSITDVDNSRTNSLEKIKSIQSKLDVKVKQLTELLTKANDETELSSYIQKADVEKTILAQYNVAFKEQNAQLKNLLKPLPKDAVCPTCSTVLDGVHRAELCEVRKAKEVSLRREIEETQQNRENQQTAIDYIETKISELSQVNRQRATLTAEISIMNDDIKRYQNTVDSLGQRLISLNTNKQDALKAVEMATATYDEMKRLKVASMNEQSKETEIISLKKEIADIEEELRQRRSSISKLTLQKGVLEERIRSKEADVDKLAKCMVRKDELEGLIKLYDSVEFAFSTKGIPYMIISLVLDSIQTETNNVLKILQNNLQVQFVLDKESKGETQDTLDMRFFINSNEWDYDDLSGGQKACVALALKFALAVVNRQRCGADIRLLMLDEVDQPLDPESTDSFYDVVKHWSKNMTIMVITHREQLKAKFSDQIMVVKENGVSTAVVE